MRYRLISRNFLRETQGKSGEAVRLQYPHIPYTRSYGVAVGLLMSSHKGPMYEVLCYEIYSAYCQSSGRYYIRLLSLAC